MPELSGYTSSLSILGTKKNTIYQQRYNRWITTKRLLKRRTYSLLRKRPYVINNL